MSDDTTLELADRMFRAIEQGDLDALRDCYDPDIVVWANFDAREQKLEQSMRLVGWLCSKLSQREYDVQRLIYHFFLKCFWNPSLAFDANAAINYDWYHPQLCTRHTLPEVESWFADAGLSVVHRLVDHYGITVRGVRA